MIRLSSIILITLFLSFGCAAKKPVLYPNDKLEIEGTEQAKLDIKECQEMAEANGLSPKPKGRAVKRGAAGAFVGSITGLAIGAVTGNPGRGAAIGAAGGGASGTTRGALDSSLDPVYRRFVERCLAEKGYEVIGWK